jgi:hypothetical protein
MLLASVQLKSAMHVSVALGSIPAVHVWPAAANCVEQGAGGFSSQQLVTPAPSTTRQHHEQIIDRGGLVENHTQLPAEPSAPGVHESEGCRLFLRRYSPLQV